MDDLLLYEVQIIEKNREKTKKIQWDYIGKYTSEKRKELSKILVKKKVIKNTEASVLGKIESNHAKVGTQEFLLAIFAQQRTKH